LFLELERKSTLSLSFPKKKKKRETLFPSGKSLEMRRFPSGLSAMCNRQKGEVTSDPLILARAREKKRQAQGGQRRCVGGGKRGGGIAPGNSEKKSLGKNSPAGKKKGTMFRGSRGAGCSSFLQRKKKKNRLSFHRRKGPTYACAFLRPRKKRSALFPLETTNR